MFTFTDYNLWPNIYFPLLTLPFTYFLLLDDLIKVNHKSAKDKLKAKKADKKKGGNTSNSAKKGANSSNSSQASSKKSADKAATAIGTSKAKRAAQADQVR
jgi:hypothetical protein